jgi:hypothetical protein
VAQVRLLAGRDPVELGADDPDDACLLQPPDPVQGRRGRQAGQAGELDVGAVRVFLQCGEQRYVNFIKINGHNTKLYVVTRL